MSRKTTLRPTIERLCLLAMFLRQGRQFTAGEVATHFEVCRKTIVRDLAFMRDRLGYQYEYTGGRYVAGKLPAPTL